MISVGAGDSDAKGATGSGGADKQAETDAKAGLRLFNTDGRAKQIFRPLDKR